MGHALMDRVARDWGDLPGNAFKVLLAMSSCAMDDGDPPVYWGGWQRLAFALGRRDWPADADESADAVRLREAHRKRVVVAVRELIAAKAIQSAQPGRQTLRAEYHLTLNRPKVDGNRPEGRTESVREPDGKSPQTGRKASPQLLTTPNTPKAEKSHHHSVDPHQRRATPVDKARPSPTSLERARARIDEGAA